MTGMNVEWAIGELDKYIYQTVMTKQGGGSNIETRYEDETFWLSQRLMAQLFDVDVRTVSEHLRNVFASGELQETATLRKIRIVQREGSRDVTRTIDHYNLDTLTTKHFFLTVRHKTHHAVLGYTSAGLLHERVKSSNLSMRPPARESTPEGRTLRRFEKYRLVQDRKYVSDFDRFAQGVLSEKAPKENGGEDDG